MEGIKNTYFHYNLIFESILFKMMNIALLSTGFLQNMKEATGITLLNYAKELKRLNNNVFIIAEKRGESKSNCMIEGVPVYYVGDYKKFKFYNRIIAHALAIRKIQKRQRIRFQVIHSFSSAPLLVCRSLFSKLFSRKAIIIHTLKSYSRNKYGQSFYNFLNYADSITVPTKVFLDILIKKKVQKNKIRIIRSHIDTQKFIPLDKEEVRKKYNYNNEKIIFYYGGLYEEKGLEVLADSIQLVQKVFPNVLFIIAPREQISTAQSLAKKIENLNNVIIINENIDVVDYLNLSDVLCLPYKSIIATEGNPSCMLEAMACKTPVITTNLPEIREIVDDEKDVLMANPGDPVSLSAKIILMLQDLELQKKLVKNAYEKSKNYDLKIITKQFLDFYNEISLKRTLGRKGRKRIKFTNNR
jgi:glycosyltransferase involved in cell wall biosynthesis